MAWTYEQASGRLTDPNGNLVGVGYSGASQWKNNPNAQTLKDRGPIPEGTYTIGSVIEYTAVHGPFVLPLEPSPANQMWGRAGFLCHGDSVVAPGTASEGCIIMSRDVRDQVNASSDKTLNVVAGTES